ncbi:MAG: GTPase Era [Candidatus Omnitrophota bacterium]
MKKFGFVSISGQPNVGKSTILNGILKEKLAIISKKPETTRDNIRGILTQKNHQIVFIDTPGIHKPHDLLGKVMLTRAQSSLMESDIILFVTEKYSAFKPEDQNIRNRLPEPNKDKKVILVINKIDKLKDKRLLLPLIEQASEFYPFDEIVPICALKDKDLDKLLNIILTHLPEGPFHYPKEEFTDKTEDFLISETIREKILALTYREVPHSIAVAIEEIQENKNNTLSIHAVIYVERASQKSIIIGSGGSMMKKIKKSARADIEHILSKKISLNLWVKVYDKWKKDPTALQELGYSD